MAKRNQETPWNPGEPAEVSPQEYEIQVAQWLEAAGKSLNGLVVKHLQHMEGRGGDYEFDAVAEVTMLEGARIIILVECKRQRRPVERDHILAVHAKMQDVGAHKAMVFSTSGFQRGAIEYAQSLYCTPFFRHEIG